MPRYIARERCFIVDRIVEEGQVIEFHGEPIPALELVDSPKPKAAKPAKAKPAVIAIDEPNLSVNDLI